MRHLAGEQLRERQRLRRHRLLRSTPLILGERLVTDAHAIWRVARPLHLRQHHPVLDVELDDLA
jgi:hypothetical protein